MPSILIVAHTPLASSLQAVARHAFAECGRQLAAVDIPAEADLDQAQALIDAAMALLPQEEVLLLVDAFGATPSNAALASAGARARVVTGVTVPMLWRTLCYGHLPLDELVTRAVDGARNGVMQVTSPRRQNQPPNRLPSHDPESNSDQ